MQPLLFVLVNQRFSVGWLTIDSNGVFWRESICKLLPRSRLGCDDWLYSWLGPRWRLTQYLRCKCLPCKNLTYSWLTINPIDSIKSRGGYLVGNFCRYILKSYIFSIWKKKKKMTLLLHVVSPWKSTTYKDFCEVGKFCLVGKNCLVGRGGGGYIDWVNEVIVNQEAFKALPCNALCS